MNSADLVIRLRSGEETAKIEVQPDYIKNSQAVDAEQYFALNWEREKAALNCARELRSCLADLGDGGILENDTFMKAVGMPARSQLYTVGVTFNGAAVKLLLERTLQQMTISAYAFTAELVIKNLECFKDAAPAVLVHYISEKHYECYGDQLVKLEKMFSVRVVDQQEYLEPRYLAKFQELFVQGVQGRSCVILAVGVRIFNRLKFLAKRTKTSEAACAPKFLTLGLQTTLEFARFYNAARREVPYGKVSINFTKKCKFTIY